MLQRIRRTFIAVSLTAFMALTLVPIAAAEQISVQMDEPFEINGQLFQNGTLTLREVSDYNPVATLNEVCVGRDCLGIFLAQELRGSVVATRNELIFGRATDGHLVLQAVAMNGGPTRGLYSFDKATSEWRSVGAYSTRGGLVTQGR